MRYYFAPMEGLTTYLFRGLHARFFPGVDKYFSPFVSPDQKHSYSEKTFKDVLPERNEGIPLVPQLLTKRPEDFLWAAEILRGMGYDEVNLNLGCPSGTVVAKGKGSGALAEPGQLNSFLEQVFEKAEVKVSVKTRLGISQPEEFWEILEIYNKYPICELTIHPRVQKDFYKNAVQTRVFGEARGKTGLPLCYNGDLASGEDCQAISRRFPALEAQMIGRGMGKNPAMVTEIKGGSSPDKVKLQAFHDELFQSYRGAFQSDKNAILRMKEYWSYHIGLYEDNERHLKKLKKATDLADYMAAVSAIFRDLELQKSNKTGI